MKKLLFIFIAGVAVLGTSCKKYLDINKNPNDATDVIPSLVFPQAQAFTANTLNSFNNYGSQTGIYVANAGGYGGFGEAVTYNYTTTSTGIFNSSYDNLEDYQYVIDRTDGDSLAARYNAAARIMKAFHFQLLVDAFNNVPYFDALKGDAVLTPAYDDAKVIYKDLVDELDKAKATIKASTGKIGVADMGNTDIMFNGDMTQWVKLANTIKLRIILRAGDKVTFSNTDFTGGFLETDVLIDPKYVRDNNRQNPSWNQWAYTSTGTVANKSWMPSSFIFGFYNGESLIDESRGRATYYKFPATGNNRLGVENNNVPASPEGSFWYADNNREGKSAGNATGILKGPDAPYPLMLAAESFFLRAEAALKGLTTEDETTLFDQGLVASFAYTLSGRKNSPPGTPADSVAVYKTANAASYLVNFNLAASDDQRLEAIITQKFIANNFIRGEEAWNEYRRTRFPRINPNGNGFETFASSVSQSPRPDKLPTRILYPITEGSTNGDHVPPGISPFTSLIFWAQ
ncbi:MAG: SusD/RagB family nutrient-binding outer membrane lipoprotein [Chitinophagaceae bacterium]